VRLTPGDTYALGPYSFAFEGVTQYRGPNYVSSQGTVVASRTAK